MPIITACVLVVRTLVLITLKNKVFN